MVEDISAVAAVLEPVGAVEGAAALNAEFRKENWANLPDKQQILVEIRPEDILLLEG